jgi:transcriptional regulator GlxA family with amidase domain
MEIVVLAIKGAPLSSIAGVVETLETALLVAKVNGKIRLVSDDGLPINCNNGLSLHPHCAVSDIESCDLVLIGPLGAPPKQGFNYSNQLITWLQSIHQQNIPIASLCTGAFLFAATELLNSRIATTHWLHADRFQHEFPEVKLSIERKITEENNLICSGGANAYLDLCLYLIEKFFGRQISLLCAKMLLINPEVSNQSEYASNQRFRLHNDDKIHQIQNQMESHFRENIKTSEMAEIVDISERQFKRRFKAATGEAPLQYLQSIRIQQAKLALENTLKSVESICYNVGYEDIRFFRALFKRHTGLTPTVYRQRYGIGGT